MNAAHATVPGVCQASPVGQIIDRDVLEQLARPAPAHLAAAVMLEWLLIGSAIALAEHSRAAWGCGLAVLFIGMRQHALLVLMHEFSHRQFSRHRTRLNDILGDVFTAFPFFVTIEGFRRDHAAHHRHTGTDQDPNWVSMQPQERYRVPRSPTSFAWIVLRHMLGLHTLADLSGYLLKSGMAVRLSAATGRRRAAWGLTVATTVTLSGAWPIVGLYWLLPMLTVLMALLYVRDVAEHLALPVQAAGRARTLRAGRIEAWCLFPYNVGLHAEHHLLPAVPFCRLHALHLALQCAHSNPSGERRSAFAVHLTCGGMRALTAELAAFPRHPGERCETSSGCRLPAKAIKRRSSAARPKSLTT